MSNLKIIREALEEADEAMMWELGGEPLPTRMLAARLKMVKAIAALDEMESAEPLFTVLMPDSLEEHTS